MVKVNFSSHHLCEECCDNTHSAYVVKDLVEGDKIGLCKSCYTSWKGDGIRLRILETIIEV